MFHIPDSSRFELLRSAAKQQIRVCVPAMIVPMFLAPKNVTLALAIVAVSYLVAGLWVGKSYPELIRAAGWIVPLPAFFLISAFIAERHLAGTGHAVAVLLGRHAADNEGVVGIISAAAFSSWSYLLGLLLGRRG